MSKDKNVNPAANAVYGLDLIGLTFFRIGIYHYTIKVI
jgi:hypothetical protein